MEDSFAHDDDLPDAEKHPFLGSKPQSRYTRVWSIVHFMALTVAAALVFKAGRRSVSFPVTCELPTREHAGKVANFGTVTRLFALDQSYVDPPSNATNAAWAALIPRGRGFVDILEDASHESPDLDDQTTMYSVSVFHQLHCLYMLRDGHFAQVEQSHGMKDGAHTHNDHNAHLLHCFDYLRQGIMCAADGTLELVDVDGTSTDGWGSVHECRDFDALFEWTESNTLGGKKGITN